MVEPSCLQSPALNHSVMPSLKSSFPSFTLFSTDLLSTCCVSGIVWVTGRGTQRWCNWSEPLILQGLMGGRLGRAQRFTAPPEGQCGVAVTQVPTYQVAALHKPFSLCVCLSLPNCEMGYFEDLMA